jgi:hypothetical protein
MGDLGRVNDPLRARFDAFYRDTTTHTTSPGADAARRAAIRRVRLRANAMGAVLVVALVGMAALYVAYPPGGAPVTNGPSPSPSATATPTPSAGATVTPTPTASNAAPSVTPGLSTSPRAAGPPDLHVSGLTSVTLQPVEGHYAGVMTLTVQNTGAKPYLFGRVYLTTPDGVVIDGQSRIFGCVGVPPPETSACAADAVPAGGGELTFTVGVTVGIAPQPTTTTLPGVALRFTAVDGGTGRTWTDPTPADNRIAVDLVLPAA